MTRKGRLPIEVPKGVEVKVDAQQVFVKGPKGTLQYPLVKGIIVTQKEHALHVSMDDALAEQSNMHGLYRSLIHNMVVGASKGFEVRLEMIGVGYRAAVQGHQINLQVGFSHPTVMSIPEGMTVKVEKNTTIVINGIDKQKVGQFAALIRSIRPPEPYQGKGIRYQNEYVRRKAGKSAAKK